MGHLLGHGVRFGVVDDVMAAGEGIETMLSLRTILPTLPMVAALSANHLAALLLPPTLRRLVRRTRPRPGWRCRDGQSAPSRHGLQGSRRLACRPSFDDFNEDLRRLGIEDFRASVRRQLVPQDVVRFMTSDMTVTG